MTEPNQIAESVRRVSGTMPHTGAKFEGPLLPKSVRPCGDYQCRCCHLWEAEVKRLKHIIRTQVPFGWVHVGALGYEDTCTCGHAVESHQGKGNFCLVKDCQCVEFAGMRVPLTPPEVQHIDGQEGGSDV